MKQPFLSKKKNVILIAFIYTFLWGCAFPLVKLCMSTFDIAANDNFSKMTVAGVRFIFSGIIALSISLFIKDKSKNSPLKKSDMFFILLYGLLGTSVQYAFTYIGLSNTSGSVGALYDQLCVFFIIIISGIFFADDKLTFAKIAGCVFGFCGVALTTINGFKFNFNLSGDGMMLLAAITQTVAYFIAKKSVGHLSAIKFVGFSHLFGGTVLTVFSVLFGGKITTFPLKGIVIMAILVAISSVAYVLSLMPLKYFSASEVSVFNLLIPIFGGIMSGIYLNEDIFNVNYLFALLLVVLGIYLVNVKQRKVEER